MKDRPFQAESKRYGPKCYEEEISILKKFKGDQRCRNSKIGGKFVSGRN